MKFASAITDRAKRYRANTDVEGPRICVFCGSVEDLGVDHLDGFEENGEPENLIWLCRSCNQLKSAVYKKAGLGRRTEQYNPGLFSRLFGSRETYRVHGGGHPESRRRRAAARREQVDALRAEREAARAEDREARQALLAEKKQERAEKPKALGRYKGFTLYRRGPGDDPSDSRRYYSSFDPDSWFESSGAAKKLIDHFKNPASSYAAWSHAVGVLKGELPGSPFRAARVIRSTPAARRYQYLAEMRNPGAQTMGAFVNALMISQGKTPGNRKAAADLISETPARRRSEFQREIWAIRKDRYGPSGRQGSFSYNDEVPF